MKAIVCKMCGYISINGSAPEKCPACGAPKTAFQEKDDAIKDPQDAGNLTELEKKHIPIITVVKKCGLIPEGCQDAHVKIGQIQHPMQEDHSIQHIDFYIDREFVARVHLTPEKLNPAAALHLKTESGMLSAVELCNLHGAWINEQEL
jgi:superoxide reductase